MSSKGGRAKPKGISLRSSAYAPANPSAAVVGYAAELGQTDDREEEEEEGK